MLKKICKCGEIIPQGVARCTKCQAAVDKDRAKYQRDYDKGRPAYHSIYHTMTWKKIRQIALVRDNYLCQECMNERGRIVQATTVHHIDTLEDDKTKAYHLDNLVSLCNSCHELIHIAYELSEQDKKDAQQRMKSYI